MKLTFGLVILIGLALVFFVLWPQNADTTINPPLKVETPAQGQILTNTATIDKRTQILDSFFTAHECPYHNSEAYISAADKWGIDWRLLPAISVIEEGCGRENPDNNLFGYYGNSKFGLHSFKSIEDGINYVAEQIATNHFYKGKSLKKQLHTYNSVNPKYYGEVHGLMLELGKD